MEQDTGADMHFLPPGSGKNIGNNQCLHWLQQMSSGHLHVNGFDSLPALNNRRHLRETLRKEVVSLKLYKLVILKNPFPKTENILILGNKCGMITLRGDFQ